MLLWPCIALAAGLILLVWSSDKFVAGAAAIAHNLGMSHILIGVTIVSMGTSAPEILVSTNAALDNALNLSLGNALGSNIANIGLVLGITALIAPIPVSARVMKIENLIVLLVSLATGFIFYDSFLSRGEGVVLLAGLVIFLLWVFYDHKKSQDDDFEDEIPTGMNTGKAVMWFVIGLGVLILSSKILVWGATQIAISLKISELVIGATVVAIGTSLPELAASVASARKGHHDIAIGNVLGSNLFNLLAVIGVPAILAPNAFAADVFWRDYLVMIFMTAFLSISLIIKGSSGKPLGRIFALMALIAYGGYLFLNYRALT
ncbi:calcium/sodium antiporter [Gynuella sunshinyii]|uniref:Ca2+/Na+ antiporter n=1 Tax=Gynuella sunshinyii YC6258 TaxID=1445510 RepID=A0A0C5VAY2_9GAMM|nr:calcium/sodium antiporter [Gynuella sunshinyii]AJQ96505.1 Ca2+/Na+ antiporter [Gynuella sunshinyii YC6258]